MEQHPVPQNVTTFQFRLIGDMTIKQFGYLASGILLAYVCYKLPLPFFFTWPLALISGLGGFGLAFVPIEERPMDVWVLSFLRNVYSPTQFIWQKQKPTAEPANAPQAPQKQVTPLQLSQATPVSVPMVMQAPPPGFHTDITQPPPHVQPSPYIPRIPVTPKSPGASPVDMLKDLFSSGKNVTPTATSLPPVPHQAPQPARVISSYSFNPLGWFANLFQFGAKRPAPVASTPFSETLSHISIAGNRPVAPMSTVATAQPQPALQSIPVALSKDLIQPFEDKIKALESQLTARTVSESRIVELQKQLTDVLNQRSVMERQLIELRKRIGIQARPIGVNQTARPSVVAPVRQPTVRVVTADLAPNMGLPRLTTFPNVVTGIIKDHEGNLLPGVLVTVRDKDDVPLRALKTNKLGQFAASTPLPSNTYFIEVEDPRNRYTFDRAQMTLNGGIVPTLEIVARSQKQVDRDKLAKEIFGNPTT